MQVESKSLTKRFLIFILRLRIKTLLPVIPPPLLRLVNLKALRVALLEGRTY